MKRSFLILLSPFIMFCQTQIGADIDGEATDDLSGYSVSLSSDGSTVAIGAVFNDGNGSDSGHVWVYENIAGVWTQIGQDIDGEAAGDESGNVVSLSSDGNIVAIGASENNGNGSFSGHVRVFENLAGVWTQIGTDIDGEASGDFSGESISLSSDGSIVAIGAPNNSGNGADSGHVRVYENIAGVWTQIGQDIDGEAVGDLSGAAISLSSDGSIVAIGAPINAGNGFESGHARVYANIAGVWAQIGQDIDGEAAGDEFSGGGVSLSSDGNIIAIGAEENDGNGSFSGHVRVYENIAGVWTQIGQDIDGEAADDVSGIGVSLSTDGSIVAIGAPGNDGNGEDSGHVRLYKNLAGVWTQIGQDIDGEAAFDESGEVSLSSDGSIVAVGAPGNAGNGIDSGHVRVYDLSLLLSSENFADNSFLMYPNPAKETLYVNIIRKSSYSIIDVFGKLVKTGKVESGENELDLKNYEAGIYFLQIKNDSGSLIKKIIKE